MQELFFYTLYVLNFFVLKFLYPIGLIFFVFKISPRGLDPPQGSIPYWFGSPRGLNPLLVSKKRKQLRSVFF